MTPKLARTARDPQAPALHPNELGKGHPFTHPHTSAHTQTHTEEKNTKHAEVF